jgi:hypothetical protein
MNVGGGDGAGIGGGKGEAGVPMGLPAQGCSRERLAAELSRRRSLFRPAPAVATTSHACHSHRRTCCPPSVAATEPRARAHAHTRALAAQPLDPGETGPDP